MILSTAEKFLILSIHPNKSRFIIQDNVANIGFIGSVFLDLVLLKAIEIKNDSIYTLILDTNLEEPYNTIYNEIKKSKKQLKIKRWIAKLSPKSRKYQKFVFIKLENKNIIQIENKSFLFFKYYKTTLTNKYIRTYLIDKIRDYLFYNKKIDPNLYMLLGLIDSCKMHQIICNDKCEKKECKSILKNLPDNDAIANGVDIVIKEMQMAITGAIIASTVVVNSSS